jgi:hypothetical protein
MDVGDWSIFPVSVRIVPVARRYVLNRSGIDAGTSNQHRYQRRSTSLITKYYDRPHLIFDLLPFPDKYRGVQTRIRE